ncbi:hypothetical protein FQN57_001152 [Myotisia sp. PD_48]|nr:hypothetical protein FQN57_001152 [Myotisia sp. PD_48]
MKVLLYYFNVLVLLALALVYAEQSIKFEGTTCSKTENCKVGCCSEWGNCGFGPDFCGKRCQSTCNAKSECGKYAPKGKDKCPLNVCCSEFGYVDQPYLLPYMLYFVKEAEFEVSAAQLKLSVGRVVRMGVRRSCGGSSANNRYIGYFQSWNYQYRCDTVSPSDINTGLWTHLNYAFAQINPKTGLLDSMNLDDGPYYDEFIALKKKKPSLKLFLSIGGWDAGGKAFSVMARDAERRKRFIGSVEFLLLFGFDGVDIDWEYPVAEDRGGSEEDFVNYVTLLRELKMALGSQKGLSIAIPASYWYLRGFNIKELVKVVDWFNIMTYDIHGTWDGLNKWTRETINPHTNLTGILFPSKALRLQLIEATEISDGLDLLWRNYIPPEKVMLGLGFYGRSFTLKDPSCTTPGCPFQRLDGRNSGGARAGECTGVSGTLSDYEINRIIKKGSLKPVYDRTAGVNWVSWDNNQWVSFDDANTLNQKQEFANKLCMGGTFAWALDLGGPGSLGRPGQLNKNSTGLEGADPKGKDSGSGEVYVALDIYKDKNPVIACIPPCTLIMPPLQLPRGKTTFTFPLFVTSLEVANSIGTSVLTLPGGKVTTTTIFDRSIKTTTLMIPPVITSAIDVWHWTITDTMVKSSTTIILPSIRPPPFVITVYDGDGNMPDTRTKDPGSGRKTQGSDKPAETNDPGRGTLGNGKPSVTKKPSDKTSGNNKPTATNDPERDTPGDDKPAGTKKPEDKTSENNKPTTVNDPNGNTSDKDEPIGTENPNGNTSDEDNPTETQRDPRHTRLARTRTITPPPSPYSSDIEHRDPRFPTVSFSSGPTKPACTAGCGNKCRLFCDTPCLINCRGGGLDFNDPNDPDPPARIDLCRGPDCKGGRCVGPLCFRFQCKGPDCISGICIGPNCQIRSCAGECGDSCNPSAKCITDKVCVGDCSTSNRCLSPNCLVLGCVGLGCVNGICSRHPCSPVTCSGSDCVKGFCKGPKCEIDNREDRCDKGKQARWCTEYVRKIQTRTKPAEYSSTTEVDCSTVTGCSAQPTTFTKMKTLNIGSVQTITNIHYYHGPHSKSYYHSIALELLKHQVSWDEERFRPTATPMPTATSKPKQKPPRRRWGTHWDDIFTIKTSSWMAPLRTISLILAMRFNGTRPFKTYSRLPSPKLTTYNLQLPIRVRSAYETMKPLYFAYGSNVSVTQMASRCKVAPKQSARPVAIGKIQGWSWFINTRGYANILPPPGLRSETQNQYVEEAQRNNEMSFVKELAENGDDCVYGILYDMNPADEKMLDLCEGVRSHVPANSALVPRRIRPCKQGPSSYNKWFVKVVTIIEWLDKDQEKMRSTWHTNDLVALVYIDEKRVGAGKANHEYVPRMQRACDEGLQMGIPGWWFEAVWKKFMPEIGLRPPSSEGRHIPN